MFYSLSVCRFSLSLMATKPHRLHQIAESSLLNASKKQRTMTTNSAMKEGFANYAQYLNDLRAEVHVQNPKNSMEGNPATLAKLHRNFPCAKNDKRERVVKASRDVTINSKKVIFQVHRISKFNKEEVLEKAEEDLASVRDQYISRLVKELEGTDFWKLRRAYSPAVQEYVEAATLCKFCKTGTLLNLSEINTSLLPLSNPPLEPLQINVLDYLLGLADLTGELMRLAIGRISDGELEYAETICRFVRDIYRELTPLVRHMDDNSEMKKKMDVMLQSVVKIENACFSVHVRGSEYIPSLGSSDPNYSFLGVPDFES